MMANGMSRRISIAAILVLSLATVASGAGLPDLVVQQIDVQPEGPTTGSIVSISAVIGNVGEGGADGDIFVRFTVDGRDLNTSIISGLPPDRVGSVTTAWVATGGLHKISVEIDRPYERIEEEDETNNSASITISVPAPEIVYEGIGSLQIAVAPFADHTRSGFLTVGDGVADKIADRLSEGGAHIFRRSELEEVMQERGLDPLSSEGITEAASLLGADIVITGTVDDIDLKQASIRIAFFSLASASADVTISAVPIAVDSGEPIFTVSAEGHDEGTSGFTADIRNLLSLSTSSTPCRGGLRTDRPWYNTGEAVSIGYLNPSAPGWYSLEIHSSTGMFIRWLGWKYIDTGACGRWLWDQKDSSQTRVVPAVYVAKLWDGTSYVASTTFQVRPDGGISLSLSDITVGSGPFEETVVGAAVNQAVDRLVADLISGLEEAKITPKAAEALAPAGGRREGQIAAILPDGRIAINIGATAGVNIGDRFEVIKTENLVIDPDTLSIISYDAVGIEGEIVIVEVHDNVSYVVRAGEFTPAIGDVVRFIEP